MPGICLIRANSALAYLRFACNVIADNLQVDRRRHTEIQDLADDIRRQEGEGDAGELARQLLAHRLDVVLGRRVVRLQADQDVGVRDADRARVVVGHVDAADAEADIVDDAVQLIGRDDLVDGLADPVGELGGLFDPRAGLRPHMHLDLPAVDAREEVLTQRRGKREREQGEAHEPRDQLGAVVQAKSEQTAIGAAEGFEAALEALLESHQGIAVGLGGNSPWIAVGVVMDRVRASTWFRSR